MLATSCPACGGQQVAVVGPGRCRCSSDVEYFEDVLVDDPMARNAYGQPGPKYERVRRARRCGHEFTVEATQRQDICTGTSDRSVCGAFATGVCQCDGCGRPVCALHGTFVNGHVECAGCVGRAQAARARKEVDQARQNAQVEAERSAAAADEACRELAAASDPTQILEALRRFARDRRAQAQSGPWAEPARVDEYLRLVVPAWQRYLAARRPTHHHEIALLANYKVRRRPDTARHVAALAPCWVSLHRTKRVISLGEPIWVDDVWAFTADTAYHIGDASGHKEWGTLGFGPTLSGEFMVCTGALPQAVAGNGHGQHLFHCFSISGSRPLTAEDVLELVTVGHQSPADHRPDGRTPIQFS